MTPNCLFFNKMKKILICNILVSVLSLGASAAVVPSRSLPADLEKFTAPASLPATPGNLTYLPDGDTYAELSTDCKKIVVHKLTNGEEVSTLFDCGNTRETSIPAIEGFILSPDASRVLVWTNSKNIYRRSVMAKYYVYEVRSRILKPLSQECSLQRSPLFSPNSRMVAFVDPETNNIRIAKLDYGSEVAATTDGAKNAIINGVPDWVYEEEFSTTCSMAWAPDNLTLSYLRYDETDVTSYSMPIYDSPCNSSAFPSLVPDFLIYKYPFPGKANSKVSLHSYDIETRKTNDIALPTSSVEYIPRISYGPDEQTLVVTTLNRDQNRLEIFRVNPRSTVVKSLYVDESKAWIPEEAYDNIVYDTDGFTVGSLRSGFFAYYTVNYQGMTIAECAVEGCDVTAYYGRDAAGNRYFQVAAPTPMDRALYCLDAKGRIKAISDAKNGTSSAQFSPSMTYAVTSFSDVTTPPVYTLCRVSSGDLKSVRVLEDNEAYRMRYASLGVTKEIFTIPASGESPELNAYIVKPSDFSPSKKYPVILSQYSGPGSQSVLNKWTLDWEQYFASKGFVVVCVDPRGTGGRGAEFMQCVYRHLGRLETIDQSNAARYIASQSWADADRIGIYGWSYGGYEALMCATQALQTPFAAACAIAPVTSWGLYDSVYTERFMLTPGQNDSGYKKSSAISRASALGCPLLVMYGTSDDNVHPENTLDFVAELQANGLMCDMFVFPGMNHSINGCSTRALVWARMFNFFSDKLKK